MRTFLSRRRYEVLALATSLFCVLLHLWSDSQLATGLTRGESSTSAIGAIGRGIKLLEGRAIDLKFRMRGVVAPDPAVAVVEIDEKSVQRYGLLPWPRTLLARALSHLDEAGAKAVGLDIAFTDEASDDGKIYRQLLEQFDKAEAAQPTPGLAAFRAELARQSTTSPDEALEAAFRHAGPKIVQGVITYNEEDLKDFTPEKVKEQAELLKPDLLEAEGNHAGSTFSLEKLQSWSAYSAQTPLRRFASSGSHLGHFSYVPDLDGTIRRTPLLFKLTGAHGLIPSLPLQTAAVYLDAKLVPTQEEGVSTGVRVEPKGGKAFAVPFQSNEPFLLINYVGPASAFPVISIGDLIEGTFDKAAVAGKALLVGVTVVGSSGDQRVTPFSEFSPGVFSHASILSSILSQRFLTRTFALALWEALAMGVIGLVLSRLIPRLQSFGLKALVIVVAAFAWLVVDEMLFARGTQLATIVPVASIFFTSFGLIFLGYLSVDREKLKIRSTFKKYLGEDVMEEALKNPEKLKQGEKREMTVLFSDIRGFTTISERMVPEKLRDFIKGYLSPMTQIVFDEKGTLDKYIGDALMAFWNAPTDQNDHAIRACRCAWKMLLELEVLKAKWRAENYPEFDIGIGINTGPMIVGEMGSDVRADYTVMGDAVNLASRLEGTNKEYETRIIISEGTWAQVQGQVVARRLGAVRVKGKRKPVRIFELKGLGAPTAEQTTAINAFEHGLDAYTEQRWAEAEEAFSATLKVWPEDPPSRRYLEEVAQLKLRPPGPGWDGVYTATTK
jgi:adenylate cyclase